MNLEIDRSKEEKVYVPFFRNLNSICLTNSFLFGILIRFKLFLVLAILTYFFNEFAIILFVANIKDLILFHNSFQQLVELRILNYYHSNS